VATVSSTGARRGRAPARGFTLLEMVVALLVIGTVAGVLAVSMTGGMAGVQLRAAAKELSAELRRSRAQAIATGTVQAFDVVPDARTWRGARERTGEFDDDLTVTFTGVREVQAEEGTGRILFFEDGASTGGRIRLQRERAAIDVDVAWLTGEVSVHRREVEP
jgi:general secretion pathway protein H